MDKMRVFIVTHDRQKALHDTLTGLFNSDFSGLGGTKVTVINNHSRFQLADEFKGRVSVLHNMTRPDCSSGNLSESYNQALVFGFGSLVDPQSEIVVTLQDDCGLAANWVESLLKLHERFTFIVGEFGDNIVSYMPEAVRQIGMWDENFCGIQHKEADYWIRALICNKEKSCINDMLHGRLLNNEGTPQLDCRGHHNFRTVDGELKRLQDDEHHHQIKRHAVRPRDLLRDYFMAKWAHTWVREPESTGWLNKWPAEFVANPPTQPRNFPVFIRYPQFEKDIEDLAGKNYFLPKGDIYKRR